MAEQLDSEFLKLINDNLGIAHKVCNVYFDDTTTREDVHQEMMYQLWKSYTSFDGRSKFTTWMYRVCLNTALTYHRKAKSEKRESLSQVHQQIPAPEEGDREEKISLLFQAIATLSSLNKAIVLLYLDDLSYEEIAGITGLTKTNVSVRLVRIKKELETIMKKKLNQ